MALTKPTLYQQVAFDASFNQIFKFNVVGGDQVVSNRLIIKNSSTLAIVYNQQQVTYSFQHVVQAGSLINGTYYTAQIQTYNSSGAESVASAPIQFYCYTTPTLVFTNMPPTHEIVSSFFNFEFTYDQLQDELLDSYNVILYDQNKSKISSSGVKYVNSSVPPPTLLSYVFGGFEDNATYYISVDGVTIAGTSVSTGKTMFTVNYINPEIFSQLDLTNDPCNGWIQIKSNMIAVPGESQPSPPIYIANKKVDLRLAGSWVKWISGYALNGDFTLKVWLESATVGANIIEIANTSSNENIKINYQNGYDNGVLKAYYECFVSQGINQPYYIHSNYIAIPANNEQIFIWLRRVNNIYQLKIENRGVIV